MPMQAITCNNCGFNNLSSSRFCSRCGHELPKPEVVRTEPIQKLPPKSNRVKTVIAIVAYIAVLLGFGLYFYSFKRSSSYDKAMMDVASEINKSCPIMVDKETRLDNTAAMPGNIFQYTFTLVNMDKATVDTLQIKSYLEERVISNVKTNPDMTLQREHRTTFQYYYKDKNSNYLFLILVSPDKYE